MSYVAPPLDGPVALSALLDKGLAEHPEEPALVSLQASWSWRELDQDADRLACNLLSLGLQPGDRVASLMPNRCITQVFYLACIRAGLVIVPLNYRYTAQEIDHALTVSEATVMLAHAERDSDIAGSLAVPELPLGMIYYSARDDRTPGLEAMIANDIPVVDLPAIAPQ